MLSRRCFARRYLLFRLLPCSACHARADVMVFAAHAFFCLPFALHAMFSLLIDISSLLLFVAAAVRYCHMFRHYRCHYVDFFFCFTYLLMLLSPIFFSDATFSPHAVHALAVLTMLLLCFLFAIYWWACCHLHAFRCCLFTWLMLLFACIMPVVCYFCFFRFATYLPDAHIFSAAIRRRRFTIGGYAFVTCFSLFVLLRYFFLSLSPFDACLLCHVSFFFSLILMPFFRRAAIISYCFFSSLFRYLLISASSVLFDSCSLCPLRHWCSLFHHYVTLMLFVSSFISSSASLAPVWFRLISEFFFAFYARFADIFFFVFVAITLFFFISLAIFMPLLRHYACFHCCCSLRLIIFSILLLSPMLSLYFSFRYFHAFYYLLMPPSFICLLFSLFSLRLPSDIRLMLIFHFRQRLDDVSATTLFFHACHFFPPLLIFTLRLPFEVSMSCLRCRYVTFSFISLFRRFHALLFLRLIFSPC